MKTGIEVGGIVSYRGSIADFMVTEILDVEHAVLACVPDATNRVNVTGYGSIVEITGISHVVAPSTLPRGVGVILTDVANTGLYTATALKASNPFYGYYITPGGRNDTGNENGDLAAAIRELQEETGIVTVSPESLTFVRRCVLRKPGGDECVSTTYRYATALKPSNTEPDKQSNWQFKLWNDARRLNLIQSIRPYVESQCAPETVIT